MAIATATCTCATCGKTFEVRAQKQNRRDADAWEIWAVDHLDECTDCYKARRSRERDENHARAAAEAQEMGWPVLTGSEKQIAWANTLREEIIGKLNDYLEDAEADPKTDLIIGIREMLLSTRSRASDWIDLRGYVKEPWNRAKFERAWIDEYNASEAAGGIEAEKEISAELDAERTVISPAGRTHDGAVMISMTEHVISASYRKDDDFRQMVKSLGYRWNADERVWQKQVAIQRDSVKERAAELGNKLLAAGFAVRIADPEIRQAAVAGDYEPETFRWIDAQDDGFFITWGRDDDFYTQAKRLPRARYVRPGVLVPAAEYEEVQDFARTHGFRFTPAAQELLGRQTGKVIVVEPAAPKEPVYDEHDPAEIMNSSADVLDDLKEENQ